MYNHSDGISVIKSSFCDLIAVYVRAPHGIIERGWFYPEDKNKIDIYTKHLEDKYGVQAELVSPEVKDASN